MASSEFEEAWAPGARRAVLEDLFDETLGELPKRRQLVSVTTGTTVGKVIATMNQNRVGCVLVLKDGRLAGIFTERDVLTRVAGKKEVDPEKTLVDQVMTANPKTLPPSASLAHALHHMSVEGHRHVPLTDERGNAAGVVSVRDIVDWMANRFPETVRNLPPDHRLAGGRDGG